MHKEIQNFLNLTPNEEIRVSFNFFLLKKCDICETQRIIVSIQSLLLQTRLVQFSSVHFI